MTQKDFERINVYINTIVDMLHDIETLKDEELKLLQLLEDKGVVSWDVRINALFLNKTEKNLRACLAILNELHRNSK